MADSKRVSGRQIPSGTSGRAPTATSTSGRQATSTSGRQAAPAGVSPSGRMSAAPAPARSSGRAAAQPAPAPVSRSKMAPATAAAPRASARTTRRDAAGGIGKAKKQRGVGGSLMLCFGILGFMGLVAGILYVVKKGEVNKVTTEKNHQQEVYDNNIKLGFSKYAMAETAGLLYCMGQEKDNILSDEEKLKSKLFGPFQGDEKVYNVVYEWRHKDKKAKDKTDSMVMFKDRTKIERMEKGELNNEIRVTYGFAEGKTVPLVIASKNIKAAEGDQANQGGTITIVCKAEEDHIFSNTRNAKPPVTTGGAASPAPAPAAEPAK